MKTKLTFPLIAYAACNLSALAQGTAFTYQGRLNDGANPANGVYDLKLTLFDAVTNGGIVAGPVTNSSVSVSNGLFTSTVDFGAAFDGNPYWLRLQVRTNGANNFTLLSPRQSLTPTPYAEFATTASNLSGTLPAAQLSGTVPSADLSGTYGNILNLNNAANTFSGNGANVTALDANNLASGTVSDARLSANVALRTGGNTFTGNQTVTSGSVGIGTAAPKTALQVNGTNGTSIRLIGPSGGGSTVAYDLSTYDPGTNPPAARILATDNGNYGNDLDLLTRIPGSLNNALVSRLHIDSTSGTISGNGGGLTSLNAANLSSGTVPDARLSANVALRAGGNNFTGNQTVASGGSVGIGTASPQANLDVVAADSRLRLQATSSGDFSATEYVTDGSSWHTGVGGSAVANGVAGEYYLYDANAGQFSLVANTNGNVGIRTTSPQYTLDVNGSVNVNSLLNVNGLAFFGSQLNVGDLTHLTGLVVNSGSGYTADMHCDLNVVSPYNAYKTGGGSWGSLSDARLKKNVRPLAAALDTLAQLRGVTFEWINPQDHANQTNVQTGFIAQEVEQVFPDWIARVPAGEHDKALTAGDKARSLALPFAYDALVVEAIKELRAQNADLKAKNQELEQRLESLERLNHLSATK